MYVGRREKGEKEGDGKREKGEEEDKMKRRVTV
jgi:hypothetical protein